MKMLLAIYDPILALALRFRKTVIALASAFGFGGVDVSPLACRDKSFLQISKVNPELAEKLPQGMGSEFMPPLNEGSLLFMPVFLP